MAVRGTMSALIAKIRLMTNDPTTGGGLGTYLSDQQIQDQLDHSRLDIRYDMLKPVPTYSSAGVSYDDYYDELRGGDIEASESIISGSFATLTPLTSDEIVGHYTFNNQLPPVYIAFNTYDLYRCAADCLELQIAARLATTFDFTADGRTININQIIANTQTLISLYRNQERARSIAVHRDDYATEDEGDHLARGGPVSGGVPFLTGP